MIPHPERVLRFDEEGVATLTLNRPESLNALDASLLESLAARLTAVARDPSVRAVVLTGAGRAFCSGGDLKGVLAQSPDRPGDAFYPLAGLFHQSILEIRGMSKPVVAAVNGPAAGGGFSLALACDLRILADSAFLQLAYTSNGLTPDGGGTFTLPRLVGLARALEIALLDERIPAARALELGLANRIAAPGEVLAAARGLALTLAGRATGALGRAKRLLASSFDTSLEARLEEERRGLADGADSAEGLEGLRAFAAKRPPNYRSAG